MWLGSDATNALLDKLSGGSACNVTYLDCRSAPSAAVYLDKAHPLRSPVARCSNATQGVLRLYTGTRCPLWLRPNGTAPPADGVADLGCYWDFTDQSFKGPRCVSSGPPRCACRTLADPPNAAAGGNGTSAAGRRLLGEDPEAKIVFKAQAKPAIKIPTISMAQLMSLSPNDIIVKARARPLLLLPRGQQHLRSASAP